ncbi:peptidase [Marinomonas agarivorans]|nr:peptidase [Marinomonas agarivorans]
MATDNASTKTTEEKTTEEKLQEGSKIDFGFIAELEGSSNKGYVPDPEQSRSGVSIAAGFDIGQRTESELKQAFPSSLCEKLLPYAGKIRQDAVDVLAKIPLTLTDEELDIINRYSHSQAEKRLIDSWANTDHYESFFNLSSQCQTVVASVAFQYGSLAKRTPNFWRQITQGDWTDALANLRNFGDKYPTRRNKEADLLASWLETQNS